MQTNVFNERLGNYKKKSRGVKQQIHRKLQSVDALTVKMSSRNILELLLYKMVFDLSFRLFCIS